MTCQQFIHQLGDYLESRLSTEQQRDALRHQAECPDCSHYLKSYRATIRLTKESAGESEPINEQLMDRWIAKLNERQAPARPRSCK